MTENHVGTSLTHVEPSSGSMLAKFEAAKTAISAALAEAKRIDEVMDVRIKLDHLRVFARQAKDREMIADAMELQLTTERRLGEMLIVAKETGQFSKGGRPRIDDGKTGSDQEQVLDSLTLKQAGIDRKLSMKAQHLAGYDEVRFHEVLAAARDKIRAGGAVVINPIKDLNTKEKQLHRDIREATLAARQKALPDKRYGVIYADPEWEFKTRSAAGMSRAPSYPTSATEVIADRLGAVVAGSRPAPLLAADDCVLFLWATNPMLLDALEVMKAWGFSYKTNMAWDKVSIGNGFWVRERHELLLIGTRGNVPAPAMGTQWDSLVSSPRGEPSVKPDWAYKLIEDYYPNLPKIELNARRPRDGWDAWGFEAPDDESRPDAAQPVGNDTSPAGAEGDRDRHLIQASGGFQEAASAGEATPSADTSVASGEADANALPATSSVAVVPETDADQSSVPEVGEGGDDDLPVVALPPSPPRPLTRDEAAPILEAKYATTPAEQLSAELGGVPIGTIRTWAFRLGLTSKQRIAAMARDRNAASRDSAPAT